MFNKQFGDDRRLKEKELQIMAGLVAAMTALGGILRDLKNTGGVSPEVTAHLKTIDDHLTSVDGLESATKNDIAAVKTAQQEQADALQAFIDEANKASSASGSSSSGSGTPSPTPAPTPAPSSGSGSASGTGV